MWSLQDQMWWWSLEVTLVFADQRAATVPLAGIHTAMSVPGTEHAGEDWLGQGGVKYHDVLDIGHL